AILASQPRAEMVFGRSQYWRSWTGNPDDLQRDAVSELGIDPNALVEAPTLLNLWFAQSKATTPCPSNVIFRRQMADRVGGFEEEFRGLFEDRAFLAKVSLTETVFVADEC